MTSRLISKTRNRCQKLIRAGWFQGLLILCLSLNGMVSAQTKKESASWLRSKLQAYAIPEEHPDDIIANLFQLRAGTKWVGGNETSHCFILYSKIRAITSVQKQSRFTRGDHVEMIPVIAVVVAGPWECEDDDLPEDSDLAPIEVFSREIRLQPSTPIEEIDRIKKAIRHLAELSGAKPVDDNLFK